MKKKSVKDASAGYQRVLFYNLLTSEKKNIPVDLCKHPKANGLKKSTLKRE